MKAPKLVNNNGSIAIQFQLQGKTYKFNPVSGGKYDEPIAIGKAQSIANQIALDITTGNFDSTLAKYKTKVIEIERANDTQESNCIGITLELWSKYVEFKRPSVSPSTIAKDYKTVASYLAKIEQLSAIEQCNWLLKNTTASAAKKIIVQLAACANWCIKSQLIKINQLDAFGSNNLSNVYSSIGSEIKAAKSTVSDNDVDCFSIEERDAILKGFESNLHYRNYLPFVQFLFCTGCRPSEAIALRWDDIKEKFLEFNKAVVISENGNAVKDGLKTQEKRRIRINSQIQNILDLAKDSNSTQFVFPSPKGKYIDLHNFANRAWRSVLEKQSIRYRNMYQTRHTFITAMLEQGIEVKDIAKYVGNSPKTIYTYYAIARKEFEMPEMQLK